MSRSEIFHSQDYSELTVQTESATEVAIAGLMGVTIVPNVTLDQFYTGDSNKIADQVQHEFRVQVDIDYAFFDGDIVQEWLGASGTSAGTWADDSDPQKFDIKSYVGESRDASMQLSCDVIGITFEEMPIVEWSQGDYYEWNLSGTGEDIENFSVGAPA